jgi:hypothetical protein
MQHNFDNIFYGGEIFLKLDDIIASFYKESALRDTPEAKHFLASAGVFFESLKKNIIETEQAKQRVEEQKKTWWGDIAYKTYINKK